MKANEYAKCPRCGSQEVHRYTAEGLEKARKEAESLAEILGWK